MAAIEKALLELLRSQNAPQPAENVINDAKNSTGADEWDVRNALWRLTADGEAAFSPGFKEVAAS